MVRSLLIGIAGIMVGILAGIIFFASVGNLPIQFDNPALTVLDVHKPQIVGFLPYWLLGKADKNYTPYITTLTYFGLALSGDGSVMKLTNPQEEEPGWTSLKGDSYGK